MATQRKTETQTADPRPEPPMDMAEPKPSLPTAPQRPLATHLPGVSQIDAGQIVTAQAVGLPRNEAAILAKIKVRAAMAGDDWYYRFPVKNRRTGQTDYVEGPSVKCAENVAQLFGNCSVKTRAIDNFDSWMIYGQFIDYETGYMLERPWQQPKGQATIGTKDPGRAEAMAFQVGTSKASRNVIVHALDFFTNFAFTEAKASIIDRIGKDLPKARNSLAGALAKMGVAMKRVEQTVGRAHADWLAADCARVNAEITAVNDGMATIDETWPGDPPPKPTRDQFEEKKPVNTPEPTPGAKPPSPANQAVVPEGSGAPAEGGVAQGSNDGEAAPTEYDIYDEQGDVESTASDPQVWALKLVQMVEQAPSRRRGLVESNEATFPVIVPLLDEGTAAKLREIMAEPMTAEPEKPKPVDVGKPAVLPKTGAGSIHIPNYIKMINEEIGAAPDEATVRAIWAREKPNRDFFVKQNKVGAPSAIKTRAVQRLHELGVQNAPDFTY